MDPTFGIRVLLRSIQIATLKRAKGRDMEGQNIQVIVKTAALPVCLAGEKTLTYRRTP